jgi:uncharacterized protein
MVFSGRFARHRRRKKGESMYRKQTAKTNRLNWRSKFLSSFLIILFGVFCLRVAGAQTPLPQSQPDEAKKADILKLFKLTNTGDMTSQAVSAIIDLERKAMPSIPESFWAEFKKEMSGASSLTSLLIPIYDKHLTHQEIKDILKFYESPSGKRFLAVLPQLTEDGMKVGQKMGLEISQQLARRLIEKGYISQPKPRPESTP